MVHFEAMGDKRKQVATMKALTVDIRRKAFAKSGGGTHLALQNMQFSVERGQLVAITGPSGCGKTTLLNIVAGLDDAYDGEIAFGDTMRQGLVYLFQTPRLLPWRTVLQNLTLVLNDPAEGERRARSLLKDVELQDFADSFPGQLSVGMQKRVALARAFALSPTLLLMDEPFSSLDPDAASRLRTLLMRLLTNNSVTTLFVTHDHEEAYQLADRILEFSAPPSRLLRDTEVVKPVPSSSATE